MRLIVLLAIANAFSVVISAQNLVPNPSFEQQIRCPFSLGDVEAADPWIEEFSADYFHPCANGTNDVPRNYFGEQYAYDGQGYCGFYTYNQHGNTYREYIEVPLTQPLVKGVIYSVSFYVSRADATNQGLGSSNNIGLYAGQGGPWNRNQCLSFTPQVNETNQVTDMDGWTRISGSFVAEGCEDWIAIGNFFWNNETTVVGGDQAYYYVDMVSVIPNGGGGSGSNINGNITNNSPSCVDGCDGSLELSASGGEAPYQYSIDGGNTFQNSGDFTGLCLGDYDIVIKDAADCGEFTQTVSVVNPQEFIASADVSSATCGETNGGFELSTSGGNAPFEYSIDDGGSYQNSNQFSNLAGGSYTIIARDVNGCTDTISTVIDNELGPEIDSVNTTNISCFDDCIGEIEIYASGGNAPLQYSIDDGGNYSNGSNFNSLCASSYQIRVNDANDCFASASIEITQPDSLEVNISVIDATCGNDNGEASLNIVGGATPYEVSIDGGSNFSSETAFSNLSPDNYDVQVRDANGCLYAESVTVNGLDGPEIEDISIQDVSCFEECDGSIEISSTGGSAPINYSINGGGNFVQDSVFTNLCAGNYTIVVRDANNCESEIDTVIKQPENLKLTTSQKDVSCFEGTDGWANVNIEGGTAPFDILWSTGSDRDSIVDLISGNYSVNVTDANGCEQEANVVISEPSELDLSISNIVNHIDCHNKLGEVEISVDGGAEPYNIAWSNGASGEKITELEGDSVYLAIVTDDNGCVDSIEATVELETAPEFEIGRMVITDPICIESNGGITGFEITGGEGELGVIWTNEAGDEIPAESITNGLPAGNYYVKVTDENNCESSYGPIELKQYDMPQASFAAAPDSGEVPLPVNFVNSSSGIEPLEYEWDFGDGSSSDAKDILYEYEEGGRVLGQLTGKRC